MNRARRFQADVTYNGATRGPGGPSAPIRVNMKREARETVQTRTVEEDDEGNVTCALTSRPCTIDDVHSNPSAQNKFVFQPVSATRVRLASSVPLNPLFAKCGGNASDPDDAWPHRAFAATFPLSKLNATRSTWRISASGRVKPDARSPMSGTFTYTLTLTLARNAGTPRVSCWILCGRR